MPKTIAIIIEWAIFACVLWVIFFLSTLLHEVGHAIGYMIATGDTHWHIRVGSGKKLLNTGRLTVKLLPFDGCFMPPEKNKLDTAAKLIATLSGGPAVSFLLTAVLLLVKRGGIPLHSRVFAPDAIEAFVSTALFINLFILILALLPTHYFYGEIKGMETDGLQIINTIKRRKA
ncbi:MAG: hypothetical protein Q4C10_00430 [Clostridia bacterium]|nr:hypothetical protein [Clostridia bacterium]